jgi:hypothetical protein
MKINKMKYLRNVRICTELHKIKTLRTKSEGHEIELKFVWKFSNYYVTDIRTKRQTEQSSLLFLNFGLRKSPKWLALSNKVDNNTFHNLAFRVNRRLLTQTFENGYEVGTGLNEANPNREEAVFTLLYI